jgi:hypothetical protein
MGTWELVQLGWEHEIKHIQFSYNIKSSYSSGPYTIPHGVRLKKRLASEGTRSHARYVADHRKLTN